VTITVAKGEPEPSPEPEVANVPNVVGMQRGAAVAALEQAGFGVSVSFAQECDPDDEACDYQPGVVWSQSPNGGTQAEVGSTVTIVVNP
jgi:beta-lactam-binding protein with PASTA domain